MFKIALTGTLLFYVISLANIEDLLPLLTNLNMWYLAAAFFVHITVFIIMSIRWWLILNASGQRINYRKIYSAYYLGLFCNNFLPTTVGGDVIRIAKLKTEGLDLGQLIFSTISDRFVGLFAVILLGITGINLSGTIAKNLGSDTLTAVYIASFIILLTLAATLNSKLRETLFNFFIDKIRFWSKLSNFITYCNRSIESLKNNTVLLKAVMLALMSQFLIVLTYYLIARSLHIDLGFMEYVLIVSVVTLFSSLPVTIGGLGLRESVIVFLFATLGVSTANAVSISLLYLAILVAITLPGGLLLFSGRKADGDHRLAEDRLPSGNIN